MKKAFTALSLSLLLFCGLHARDADSARQAVTSGAAVTGITNGVLTVRYAEAWFTISLLENGIIRLHSGYKKLPATPNPYSVRRVLPPQKAAWQSSSNTVYMESDGVRVEASLDPFRITVSRQGASLITFEPQVYRAGDYGFYLYSVLDAPGKNFYGLGSRPSRLNLSNTHTINLNMDWHPNYATFPMLLALSGGTGCGIFVNTPGITEFAVQTVIQAGRLKDYNSILTTLPEGMPNTPQTFWCAYGDSSEVFIIPGKPRDITRGFAFLTGAPALPPLWALGFHQCRYSYKSQAEVMRIADEFAALRMPLESLWLDIDYMNGFRTFTVNTKLFPDLRGMTAGLAARGIKTVAINDPGIMIDENYGVFNRGLSNHAYVFLSEQSHDYFEGKVWPGYCYFPDFTDPWARQWWTDEYARFISNTGIQGHWNDMNEPSVFKSEVSTWRSFFMAQQYLEGTWSINFNIRNLYGLTMALSTYNALRQIEKDKRPFVLTRSGYPGAQRYAFIWTGDNSADWTMLGNSIKQVLSLGLCGMPWAGADIGGFRGVPDDELMARWLQVGVFYPFMRDHTDMGTRPQEPGAARFTNIHDINRKSLELRYRLLPYIYTAAYQASLDGTPIARPLFYDYGMDYAAEDRHFLFGPAIVVSPVVKRKATNTTAVLPEGAWTEYWSGRIYTSGTHTLPVSLSNIPLFVKNGTLLPVYDMPLMNTEGLYTNRDVTWLIYPDSSGRASGTLYEDSGNGYEYEKGVYRLTEAALEIKGSEALITIKRKGDFNPEAAQIFILPEGIKSARINGAKVAVKNGKAVIR